MLSIMGHLLMGNCTGIDIAFELGETKDGGSLLVLALLVHCSWPLEPQLLALEAGNTAVITVEFSTESIHHKLGTFVEKWGAVGGSTDFPVAWSYR